VCLGQQGVGPPSGSARISGPPRPSRGFVFWMSTIATLVMAAGILFAVDPRLGGAATRRLLDLTSHGGFGGAPLAGALWVATLTNTFLLLLASAIVSTRRLYTDRLLLPLVLSPTSSRLLAANRVVASTSDLMSIGRITLLPLLWLIVTGPGSLELAASGAVIGLATIASSALLGFLVALLIRASTEAGPVGRLAAPLLALLPAGLAIPLVRVGPAVLNWQSAAASVGVTALLAAATLLAAPQYRAGVFTAGSGADRPLWRPAGFLGRGGLVAATLNRDVSLVASNPVTYFRLLALLLLVVVYPLVETRLGTLGHLLLPGVFGLPLAYALGAWFVSVSEIEVSLGQVDGALRLAVAASPCRAADARLAGFLSNSALGVPTCVAAGFTVLALSKDSTCDAVGLLGYAAALVAVALGQAALAASLSRSGTNRGQEVCVDSTGWIGMLLEQVPLNMDGLRTLGLLVSHLALTLVIPSQMVRFVGTGPAYALLILCAVFPVALLTVHPGRRNAVLRPR